MSCAAGRGGQHVVGQQRTSASREVPCRQTRRNRGGRNYILAVVAARCLRDADRLARHQTSQREVRLQSTWPLVFPLYGLLGLPIIDALSVTALICPAPLAVVGNT